MKSSHDQFLTELETLSAADRHFHTMLDLNPDLEEAKYARANLKSIDTALAAK